MHDGSPKLTRISDRLGQIELCRPLHANRIQPDDLEMLERHLCDLEADRMVSALLITAEGKTFSAGYDLRALVAEASEGRGHGENIAFERFANRLAETRLATVVAVNGPAVGGASDIVLACDVRIGVPAAKLIMPAARIGLPLYAGALERYVTNLGLSRAKSLVIAGIAMDAQEMCRSGVLMKIVEPEELLSVSKVLASSISEQPAIPLASMKAALHAFARSPADLAGIRKSLSDAFDGKAVAERVKALAVTQGSQQK